MDEARLRIHLGVALNCPDIRRGVAAVEQINSALYLLLLDDLPVQALEVIKDYVEERGLAKDGDVKGLKEAYHNLLIEQIAETKKRNRRLFHGITGIGEPEDVLS
jgi:hypothetical protein